MRFIQTPNSAVKITADLCRVKPLAHVMSMSSLYFEHFLNQTVYLHKNITNADVIKITSIKGKSL